MEPVLFIKVVIALAVGVAWLVGKLKLNSAQPAPLAAAPPPLARRVRRIRPTSVKALAVPPAIVPIVAAPVHLDDTSLVVTRPARAQSRAQFFGRAALRQAIVAREVLGLPLALRPPRF
jgi:xanthine/uracil permease